jgi:hypothetical protein
MTKLVLELDYLVFIIENDMFETDTMSLTPATTIGRVTSAGVFQLRRVVHEKHGVRQTQCVSTTCNRIAARYDQYSIASRGMLDRRLPTNRGPGSPDNINCELFI